VTPKSIGAVQGIGKILIVVNAGSDTAGDIILSGTQIDRETGLSLGIQTSTITINGTTTDGSTTDVNGNTKHSFTKAYISDKWFTGTVNVYADTGPSVNLSDVDYYHVSFEQFNDQPNITLDTMDFNLFANSVNAEFDAYLYALEVTGDECDISLQAECHLGAETNYQTPVANRYYRLRKGNIAKSIDGSTDGIWVDIHYSTTPAGIEDVTGKVWATETRSLILT
jgi:hypothetical protein